MSSRVTVRTLRNTVAIAVVMAAASALGGCSTMGMGGDDTVTGSARYQGTSNLNQPMPGQLDQQTQVAEGPFIPPEDIGGGPSGNSYGSDRGQLFPPVQPSASPSISSQDLPVIGNMSSQGNSTAMSAQPAYQHHPSAGLPPMPPPQSVASLPAEPIAPCRSRAEPILTRSAAASRSTRSPATTA